MTNDGYAVQIGDDYSSGAVEAPVSGRNDWMLNRFSHVLAIALRKKLWTAKQCQPLVPFDQVIERVKQAQSEHGNEKKPAWNLHPDVDSNEMEIGDSGKPPLRKSTR